MISLKHVSTRYINPEFHTVCVREYIAKNWIVWFICRLCLIQILPVAYLAKNEFFVDFAASDDRLVIFRKISETILEGVYEKNLSYKLKTPQNLLQKAKNRRIRRLFWSFFSSCRSFWGFFGFSKIFRKYPHPPFFQKSS